MKHFNFKILLVVLMSLFGTKAIAYDIVVKNSDSIAIFYNYINNDKELEVTCYSEEIVDPDIYYGNIVIPDEVLYNGKTLKVTSIGNKAFYGCEKLMSVSFPKNLTSIGKDAFFNCKNIQQLYISEGVTSIEYGSFAGCYGLSSIIVANGNMNYDSRYNCNAIIETKTNTLIVGCNKTTIPNDIIAIGYAAFCGCNEIKNIELPKAVKEIHSYAFASCNGLTSINLPSTLTILGYGAFEGCSSLSSINIPSGIEYIPSNLFAKCSGLISLTIPNNVTNIGEYAFYECTSLKSISLPNSVNFIGSCAFSGCHNLIDFVIPNNIKEIKYDTFAHCINLESVTIPKSVKLIGDGAFRDCPALKDVYCLAEDVPETISHLFYTSMYNNITLHVPESSIDKYKNTFPWNLIGTIVALTNEEPNPTREPNSNNTIAGLYLTQPDSYRVYNGNTEKYGRAFEVLIIDNGDGTYYVDDLVGGWYCQRAGYGTNYAISGNIAITADGNVSLKDSFVPGWGDGLVGLTGKYDSATSTFTIEAEYINGMKFFETWVKNDQIVNIDGFNYILGLDKTASLRKSNYTGDIVIPNQVIFNGITYSITSIDEAFKGCEGLTSVTIPNSVTTIGSDAFSSCKDLKTVNIPNSVTSIDRAFNSCTSLSSISIPNSVTSIGDYAFRYCSSLSDLTIPNSVISIGDWAFEGCTGLKTITLSNNLTSIGQFAFYGCENIETITLPSSVTSIGESAFMECHNLTNLILSENITTLGQNCFTYCYGLKSVTIPKSVLSIGVGAFSCCGNIESINVDSENSKYDSRNNCNAIIETYRNRLLLGCNTTVIPEDINRIGPSAFAYCSDLKDLNVPNSVKYIEEGVFWSCNGFSSFKIGNNVEFIGHGAFSDCEALKSIIIPKSVKTIEYYTFYNCKKLKDVYCYADELPTTDKNAFEETPINNATLHVPAESLEEYKSEEPWSGFGKIVALTSDETDVETHILDTNNSPVNIFSINGQRLSKPKRGLNIIRMSDGSIKKVIIK